jgi:ABC-type nitrate/sulfonate/bicarbonate transport system permease component
MTRVSVGFGLGVSTGTISDAKYGIWELARRMLDPPVQGLPPAVHLPPGTTLPVVVDVYAAYALRACDRLGSGIRG